MKKGHDPSMQESKDWKAPYLKCYSACAFTHSKRERMRKLILDERLIPELTLPTVSADVPDLLPAAVRPVRSNVFSRLHRSGVGYVAAAAACFVAIGVTQNGGSDRFGTQVDPAILRYARLLPADFDLEGDASALPSVVSEVMGGAATVKGQPFELHLPESLREHFVPREGRFFTGPEGQLGVAIKLRPHRSADPKSKTLYMLPSRPSVEEVLPQNNLARFVNFSEGEPLTDDGSWNSGNLSYMLLDQ